MSDVAVSRGVHRYRCAPSAAAAARCHRSPRSSVQQAAEELGYQVNLVGRALRRRRSSTVGLIVPDLDNPFFSSLAQHLSRTFEPSAIDLLVFRRTAACAPSAAGAVVHRKAGGRSRGHSLPRDRERGQHHRGL